MVGLHYLKHVHDLSDEELVARWVENPYCQFFCGFEFFQHEAPIDASTMTRWRKRIGPAGLEEIGQTIPSNRLLHNSSIAFWTLCGDMRRKHSRSMGHGVFSQHGEHSMGVYRTLFPG